MKSVVEYTYIDIIQVMNWSPLNTGASTMQKSGQEQ